MTTFELEKQYKKEFTKRLLRPLLKEINRSIIRVEYETKDCEEFIIVTFDNSYTKKICVTADSTRAMVIDCLERI